MIEHEIPVPGEWLKKSTLVQYDVIGSMSNLIYSALIILHTETKLLFHHIEDSMYNCSQPPRDIQSSVSIHLLMLKMTVDPF